jgi:hypothetical protein
MSKKIIARELRHSLVEQKIKMENSAMLLEELAKTELEPHKTAILRRKSELVGAATITQEWIDSLDHEYFS